MSQVSIIGAYNTVFGSFVQRNKETGEVTDKKSIYELITEAGLGALADAHLSPKEVDGVWIGSCSPSLFCNQEHVAPLAVEIDPNNMRFLPMTRVENACATSSIALYNALYAIESGRFKTALVVGVEKMSLLDTAGVTHALACCSFWPEEGKAGMTFPGLFAELAKAYKAYYKIPDEVMRRMLATCAATMYANSVKNPLAHFGPGSLPERLKLFTAEAILGLPDEKNPMIADPLRLHDCSLVSDGAAAVVLTTTDLARSLGGPVVEIAGIGHAMERPALTTRNEPHRLAAAIAARQKAFAEAGIGPENLNAVEVHDCFTIAQILCTEALGLAKEGRAGYEYLEGRFGPNDRCPVNLSGGLKGKGHPVGATGASMHVLLYKQLTGQPIGVGPVSGQPEIAATLNIGGSAVTNAVTVLRRLS